jgi:heme-degrading monooxygenase HmoA
MYGRVTQFEIDVVVAPVSRAVARFTEVVLPELRQQPGFAGVLLLANEEGRGELISLWESEQAANEALATGFYDEQASKFVTIYRQPPGREQFEVRLLEMPATTPAAR